MKAFVRFTMALLVCALSSCSSDDDSSPGDNNAAALLGIWSLVELNVSPPQDVNSDGTASANLMDELTCISGTLTFNADNTWNLSFDGVSIISITGDLYDISCATRTSTSAGTWQLSGTSVSLFLGGTTILYTLNGDLLTNTIGEDLPNIRSEVYQKQ